jgi:hypothetical protein
MKTPVTSKFAPLTGALISVCCCLWTGCITHEETIYRDDPRTRIEFENDTAARIFYEAMSHGSQPKGGRTESKTEVDIPIIFEHKQHVVQGPNAAFNVAVERCDTNRDGKITEAEARIYAEQRRKP